MTLTRVSLVALLASPLTLACTGEDVAGTGELTFTATGGGFMREGIPFEEAGFDIRHEFVDGWTMTFDNFLMSLGRIELREQLPDGTDGEGDVVGTWEEGIIVDLTQPPSGAEVTAIPDLPATRLDVGFELVAAHDGLANGGASAEDYERMIEEGWTAWISGVATRDGERVEFSIGLDAPTRFRRCANGVDGTRGIAIQSNSSVGVTIYPHLTHFWWDVLLDGEQRLRFDPWAAVAGDDGVVTTDELANQDLLGLIDANGDPLLDPETGGELRYDDGGVLPPNQLDLLSYTEYAFRQSVHFNGLGFCPWSPLD